MASCQPLRFPTPPPVSSSALNFAARIRFSRMQRSVVKDYKPLLKRSRVILALIVVLTAGVIYQVLFRYEYIPETRTFGYGISRTVVVRIDKLTGDMCQVPCR